MVSTATRRHTLALFSSALTAAVCSAPARAQSHYPDKPIRLIVPRSAGGPLDVVARQWAERVKSSLGSVVIENMGGGSGIIGTAAVARAQPDGYTLALSSTSDMVLNPLITPNIGFDPEKDFRPVAILVNSPGAIVINGQLPARTLAEFVAYAKTQPGKLSYGSAGAGTMSNLAGELFKQIAGLPDIVHVPYKGSAPGVADLVSGHIPMMALNISDTTVELHRSGKIRILAVGAEQRITPLPDVPTGAEAGYPDFVAQLFIGLFAPASTPQQAMNQLAAATAVVMRDAEFRAKLSEQGFEPIAASDPQSAAQYVRSELKRWGPVLKTAGMKS